jgi:multisubunit Na+/H+ antiporter MnhE subunit
MNENLIAAIVIVIFVAVVFAILPDSVSKGYVFIGLIIGIIALLIGVAFYRRFAGRINRRHGR